MAKTIKIVIGIFVAVILLSGTFAGGFIAGHLVPTSGQIPFLNNTQDQQVPYLPPTVVPEQQSTTPSNLQTLFGPFWEAWNIIHDQYVVQPIDDVKLMQGAINGMMESLGDKHSTYMDPQTYKDANADLAGAYEGIGAYVDTTADFLTVISPILGSPAEKAGLQPGDKIIKIDGVDMTGIDGELVRRKVLGPAGSTVVLTVVRKDVAAPLEVSIIRDKITIKSATGKMLENDIAYVQVNTFGDNTTSELKATLTELMAKNPKGLILDLRNNGGGYLQTSVEVVSQFASKGVVLYEKYGDGKQNQFDVIPGGLATDIPMVVLINEGSASASEITAGALQDYGRAKLIGVVSYGKGSVQNWVPLSNEEGAVRVTIAKWYTPNDRTIDGKGLTPDVYVPMTLDDFKAGLDPQLDTAVQTLLAILNNTAIPTSMPTPVNTPIP
ncbi:MAG: S41 family peptidase [Chloroflexota bacterium]